MSSNDQGQVSYSDVLLLDNMTDAQIREAVKIGAGRVQFESPAE